MKTRGLLALAACAGLIGGCAQTREDPPVMLSASALAADDGFDARSLVVHRGDGTGAVAFAELVEELDTARVVLVGELHGHERGLDFIATLFDALCDADPDLALSMEFYERDQQGAVDDYVMGVIDADAFAALTRRNPGNNPVGHQRMVERARADGRRIVAANAPRRAARFARTGGYDAMKSMTSAQRAYFIVPETLPGGLYAQKFRDAMGGMAAHGGDEMVNSFLRAQALWDATMAESVSDQAARGTDVYHVVGAFHVEGAPTPTGSLMTDLIRARLGRDDAVRTLIVRDSVSASLKGDDVGAADYVVYVGGE